MFMKIRCTISALFGLVGFVSLGGCSSADSADFSDENVATSSAALSTSEGTQELGNVSSSDPATAADGFASTADKNDCRTRTRDASDPNVVHVTLTNCTGRLGRHSVSGTITITFSANADGSLHAEHQSDSLTVDGNPATHHASADITFDGDQRHIIWHGTWTHTGKNGEVATHTGDRSIDVDRTTHCRTVNGTGVTHIGDREINSTISDFKTCEGPNDVDTCPTGTIEHDNLAKQRSVTESFDGSDVAHVDIVKPKGEKSRDVTLNCGPGSAP
jgi:hypothetical protein